MPAVRPPLETSDFQVTAATIRSLLAYAPEAIERNTEEPSRERFAGWQPLSPRAPKITSSRYWADLGRREPRDIRKTASTLLELQRPDGGWGQIPALASDAYATGQALVALRESGIIGRMTSNIAVECDTLSSRRWKMGRGWWGTSPSFQPYFDSDFPHGYDQFISAAARNWA